ncbi:MAG: hydantoinase B/oxoprolinase family protein [Chloroflexi bacterium]|nr:hydantoinase B/oxoprolinase family protein [Chloroflexota bacterium]
MNKIDPITLEVLRGSFHSIVEEMRATLIRTAYSPILSLSYDFSCGLLSPKGELIGMSEDFSGHVFAMSIGLPHTLAKFGGKLNPGDVVMMNDPYIGGTHLNDVVFYTPYFAGKKLLLFIAVRAHWQDIGGSTAGSFTGRATSILEEGLRIPPVKVVERGKRNMALWDTIFSNVRLADERQGDALAMLDTTRVAEMRADELVAKYGANIVERGRDEILDSAERVMRKRIASLPKGEYYYEHYMDNDGMSNKPVPIKIKLTIENDSMTFDFTGTGPQSVGPTNGGPPIAPSAVFVIVKSWLDPETSVSGGSFRPLKFVLPKKTMVNAEYPAPVGACWGLFRSIQGATIGLFSQVMPQKAVGDVFGEANHTYITGFDLERNKEFILYEYPMGGYPGTSENDGSTGSKMWDVGGVCIYPAESAEERQPVLMESAEVRRDGEGPGFHRSAFGITRKIKVLTDCQLSVVAEKVVIPPFGTGGGYAGSVNTFSVLREGEEIFPSPDVPGKIKAFPLKTGDVVIVRSSGGGGVGDPLTRDPEDVRRDVIDGYLSAERAAEVYGVILKDGVVKAQPTHKRRESLKQQRRYFKVAPAAVDSYNAAGLRLCPISPSDASSMSVVDGDLVEYVPPVGAPLRAWVVVKKDQKPGKLPLGPQGMRILRVTSRDSIELRVLKPGMKKTG